MNEITIQIVSVIAILGFLWSLHREIANLRKETQEDMAKLRRDVSGDIAGMRTDVVDLRERMARMEGLLEGFVARPQESRS